MGGVARRGWKAKYIINSVMASRAKLSISTELESGASPARFLQGRRRFAVGIPQLLKDVPAVLSKQGRWQPVHDRLLAQPDWISDAPRSLQRGMFQLDHQPARQRLRIPERFTHGLDRGNRNISAPQPGQPGVAR